jgi:cell division protein FtsB
LVEHTPEKRGVGSSILPLGISFVPFLFPSPLSLFPCTFDRALVPSPCVTIDAPSVADLATANALEKDRRRAKYLRLTFVFLGCVLLLDAVVGERGLFQTIRSRQDLLRAEQQLADLKRENAALRGEVHRLQQDPATLEFVARQQLGLVRAGEILVVLTDVK